MDLAACLPAELRDPAATFVKIAAGLSGAAVYRVDARGKQYVLKLATDVTDARIAILRAAASAGVAPAVVHVDVEHRAVVSALIVDRSFIGRISHPGTRATAIDELATTLRRVHALPLPAGVIGREPRAFLDEIWTGLRDFPVPPWTGDVVRRVLDTPPPPARPPVLSHNDPNPSNLVYDGTRVLLLDWDTAGANDPYFDLATVAVFLRMTDADCMQLIAVHDEAPVAELPAMFCYLRRTIAALCGAMFLHLARMSGHPGARGDETIERAPTLTGPVDVRTPDGRWTYGQALLKQSAAA